MRDKIPARPAAQTKRSLLELRPVASSGLSNEEIDRLFARESATLSAPGTSAELPAPTRSWQMQDAKNRLSEVIRSARADGPQEITVRGRAAAYVISPAQYEQVFNTIGSALVDALLAAPRVLTDAEADDLFDSRRPQPGRAVELG